MKPTPALPDVIYHPPVQAYVRLTNYSIMTVVGRFLKSVLVVPAPLVMDRYVFLNEQGLNCVALTSNTPPPIRQEYLNSFLASSNGVLIGTPHLLAQGIDLNGEKGYEPDALVFSNTLVIRDAEADGGYVLNRRSNYFWQILGRVHRFGRKRPIHVFYLHY